MRPDPELDRIPSSVRTQEPGQWWHRHEQKHESHPSQSAWQPQQHSETQSHTLALLNCTSSYSYNIFDINMLVGLQTLGIVSILAHRKILHNRQTNGQRIPFRSISASPPFTQQTFLNNCPPHPMTRKLVTWQYAVTAIKASSHVIKLSVQVYTPELYAVSKQLSVTFYTLEAKWATCLGPVSGRHCTTPNLLECEKCGICKRDPINY